MDITTRGPAAGSVDTYTKYTSKFSPDSVTHIIQVRPPASAGPSDVTS